MMLTRVDVVTPRGEVLALPFQDISGGYVIHDIDGLDPVRATISSSSFAQLEGAQYQNAQREARNLIFKLGFEPDYATTDVRGLRSELYRFLMPKSEALFRFYIDDVLFVEIAGRVETFEAPLFTRDPGATISVLCFDPDFVVPPSDLTVVNGLSVTDNTEMTVTYPGTIEAGVLLSVTITAPITELQVYSGIPGGDYQAFDFAAALEADDILEIQTVPGAKGAWIVRSGVRQSVLYGASPASTWFKLYQGDNLFRVATDVAGMPYTIQYRARYGGL